MVHKKPGRKAEPPSKRRIAWPRWTGFRGKTVWDWLQLFIVPLVLALIGILFAWQQDTRQQEFENQRAASDRQIEEQRAQDAALQAYLDQMSTLLIEKDLRGSTEGSEVRTPARARTLTVLGRLDPSRKTEVMQFLEEAELIQSVEERVPIIALAGADLSHTDLGGDQVGAPDFSGANLEHADLHGVFLPNAELEEANLGAADLSGTDLSGANLSGADLRDVQGVTKEQLAEAESLQRATMPNRLKYEDLLKSKGSGEDGQNSSP